MPDRNIQICYWCGKLMDWDTIKCPRCGMNGPHLGRTMPCPACREKVSFKAKICPKCGHPITEKDINEYASGLEWRWKEKERRNKEQEGQISKISQDKESQGCFIATAVFESPFASEVVILREFRDRVLNKFILGRLFVAVYYWLSLSVANSLEGNKILKNMARKSLTPLVQLAKRFNK